MEASQSPVDEMLEIEAEYTLESPVKCSACGDTIQTLAVVRLLRTKVNFTSALPRRGCVTICPSCRTMVPAAIG
jgi:hypothetical protein